MDEEMTADQAVRRALLLCLTVPVSIIITRVVLGQSSLTGALVLLALGAALFPLVLLSLWGKVKRDGPRR
jgi:hypothetical protein